jgi:hypothetical protein
MNFHYATSGMMAQMNNPPGIIQFGQLDEFFGGLEKESEWGRRREALGKLSLPFRPSRWLECNVAWSCRLQVELSPACTASSDLDLQ